jgi:hypothetical protein
MGLINCNLIMANEAFSLHSGKYGTCFKRKMVHKSHSKPRFESELFPSVSLNTVSFYWESVERKEFQSIRNKLFRRQWVSTLHESLDTRMAVKDRSLLIPSLLSNENILINKHGVDRVTEDVKKNARRCYFILWHTLHTSTFIFFLTRESLFV